MLNGHFSIISFNFISVNYYVFHKLAFAWIRPISQILFKVPKSSYNTSSVAT